MLPRTHGLHEMRRDDDDEIGLALLEVGGSKEGAEDGNVAEPGKLIDALRILRLDRKSVV